MITWQSIKNEAEGWLCAGIGIVLMLIIMIAGPLILASILRGSKRITQIDSHADEAMDQWISQHWKSFK